MPDISDIISSIERLLPLLGTIVGHPELGVLGQRLIDLAEDEIARRRSNNNMTREEVLADAARTYAEARAENDRLKKLGHEEE